MPSLLVDEIAARIFLTQMVPPLKNDEILLIQLVARHKYEHTLRSEGVVMSDFLHYSDIDYILHKIKRMSQIGDFYVDNKTKKVIPANAFVLYINLLPKSVLRGYTVFQYETNELIYQLATLPIIKETMPSKQKEGRMKQYQIYLDNSRCLVDNFQSAIHRSNSDKPYIIIDIDHKDKTLLLKILEQINYKYTWISETHGGYHIIISIKILTLETGRIINKEIAKPPDIQVSEEAVTPIPGMLQGGFLVKRFEV
jgi:hypothetical protein